MKAMPARTKLRLLVTAGAVKDGQPFADVLAGKEAFYPAKTGPASLAIVLDKVTYSATDGDNVVETWNNNHGHTLADTELIRYIHA